MGRSPYDFHLPMESSEVAESVATLHETAPKASIETVVIQAQAHEETEILEHHKMEDAQEAMIYGNVNQDIAAAAPEEIGKPGGEVIGRTGLPAPGPSTKAFLGKGKIDAKAQDDFIAFMLGKK